MSAGFCRMLVRRPPPLPPPPLGAVHLEPDRLGKSRRERARDVRKRAPRRDLTGRAGMWRESRRDGRGRWTRHKLRSTRLRNLRGRRARSWASRSAVLRAWSVFHRAPQCSTSSRARTGHEMGAAFSALPGEPGGRVAGASMLGLRRGPPISRSPSGACAVVSRCGHCAATAAACVQSFSRGNPARISAASLSVNIGPECPMFCPTLQAFSVALS